MIEPMPAGIYLKKLLEAQEIGQIILAQDTGLSTKTINSICKGKARITPKIAVLFEKFYPPHDAKFWLQMDMNHQVYLARTELEKTLHKNESELKAVREELSQAS